MTGAEKRRERRPEGPALLGKKQKGLRIHQALTSDPIDMDTLQDVAVSDGGLLSQEIRRKVWPKLLNINIFCLPPKPGSALRANHRDYNRWRWTYGVRSGGFQKVCCRRWSFCGVC
ncbi:unnamed protein product, partial [Staurois parvus]